MQWVHNSTTLMQVMPSTTHFQASIHPCHLHNQESLVEQIVREDSGRKYITIIPISISSPPAKCSLAIALHQLLEYIAISLWTMYVVGCTVCCASLAGPDPLPSVWVRPRETSAVRASLKIILGAGLKSAISRDNSQSGAVVRQH